MNPSSELPPVNIEYDPEGPCAEHLGRLAVELEKFGVPPGMYRVGEYDLGAHKIPMLLPGVGEGHTLLEDADHTNLEIARSLIMQIFNSIQPGTVKLTVVDTEMTNAFADFSHLGEKLFSQIGANELPGFISKLTASITERNNKGKPAGTLTDPYELIVLAGQKGLRDEQLEGLNGLIASGAEWGSIVALGAELESNEWLQPGRPGELPLLPDRALASPNIMDDCLKIAGRAEQGIESPRLADILPEHIWTRSSKDGLVGYVGKGSDGSPIEMRINDESPHGLVTGRTGSGKSVLIKAWVSSLTANYSPEELQLMILDFKQGVEFASMAPQHEGDTYLPHALLVGSEVNEDPEFGLKSLRYLQAQLKKRGDIARSVGAKDYTQLRENAPDETIPRIVIIIDEFQVLLDDPVHGAEVARQLEDISRRGRSFGIHMVLSTQDVSGITQLYGKSEALFKNLPLRATTRNGSMLNIDNLAPADLPKYHAAINHNSGNKADNEIAAVANATPNDLAEHQKRVYDNRPAGNVPPKVFSGKVVPTLAQAKDFARLRPQEIATPKVLLADEVSVSGGTAAIDLTRQPGKNVAVVGIRPDEVHRVMNTAAISLAKQRKPETAEFSFVCVDAADSNAVEVTAKRLRQDGHSVKIVGPNDAPAFLGSTAQEIQSGTPKERFVFVYGAGANKHVMDTPKTAEQKYTVPDGVRSPISTYDKDVAVGDVLYTDKDGNKVTATVAGKAKRNDDVITVTQSYPSGSDSLRSVMSQGPEKGVHVVMSAVNDERLKSALNGESRYGSSNEKLIGGYVAIGLAPNAMSSFTPDQPYGGSPDKTPDAGRSNRATFYDASSRKKPRVVIPYGDPAFSAATSDEEDDFDDY